MKTSLLIDENAEFYVRDLLDWRAGLKRLGFVDHKFNNMEQWSLLVKLGWPVSQAGWKRQVSHAAIDVDGTDGQPQVSCTGIPWWRTYVKLSAALTFGFPMKVPNMGECFRFRNMFGYTYDQNVIVADDDSELRKFLQWLKNLIGFIEKAEVADAAHLRDVLGTMNVLNKFALDTTRKEMCDVLRATQEKRQELNSLARRFERQNNRNNRVKWQHRKK